MICDLRQGEVYADGELCYAAVYSLEKEEMMDQHPKILIERVSGYSPHIGVLVSTLERCREKTIRYVQDLTIKQLDYLWDANTSTKMRSIIGVKSVG